MSVNVLAVASLGTCSAGA